MHEYQVQIQPCFLSPTTATTTATRTNLETHHLRHILSEKQTIADPAMATQAAKLYNKNISGPSQRPQSDSMVMLSSEFAPGEYDVICQRGKLSAFCFRFLFLRWVGHHY